MLFGEKIQRVELPLDVVDIDSTVNLSFINGNFLNVHVTRLAVGPTLGPIDAVAVVFAECRAGRADARQSDVLHNQPETLSQFKAFGSGVNFQFTGAAANILLTVALPGHSSNNDHALKGPTFVDCHAVVLVGAGWLGSVLWAPIGPATSSRLGCAGHGAVTAAGECSMQAWGGEMDASGGRALEV